MKDAAHIVGRVYRFARHLGVVAHISSSAGDHVLRVATGKSTRRPSCRCLSSGKRYVDWTKVVTPSSLCPEYGSRKGIETTEAQRYRERASKIVDARSLCVSVPLWFLLHP